jgi:hypothetical protein
LGPDSYPDLGSDDEKFKNLHMKVETSIVDSDFCLLDAGSGGKKLPTKIEICRNFIV